MEKQDGASTSRGCNRIYGTRFLLFAHSRPFLFLLYEREGIIWSCFASWVSCPLAGIVSWGVQAGVSCLTLAWNGCGVPFQTALHGCLPNPSSTEQGIFIKPSQKWLMLHLLQSQHWSVSLFVPLFLWSPGQQIKIRAGAQGFCRLQIHGYLWAWLGGTFREPNLGGTVCLMVVDYRPLKVFYLLNYSVILSLGRQTGPLGIHPFPLAVKGVKWRANSDRGIYTRDLWSCGFIIMQPSLNVLLHL